MEKLESVHQVPALAVHFHELVYDPRAVRSVGTLAWVFVWSDERPARVDADKPLAHLVPRFFEGLVWYRDSLIRQRPFERFSPFWNEFQNCCPTWPGFAAERTDARLLTELESESARAQDQLARLFDECAARSNRKFDEK